MNIFKEILGKYIDVDTIKAEAMAIAGDRPSSELLLALSIKALAEKYEAKIKRLEDELFVKDLLENQTPVADLDSHRNMKAADANLAEIIPLMDEARQKTAELDKTITLGQGPDDFFDSKDIYLTTTIGPGKIKQIVGLHAIGHAGPYEYTVIELDKTERKVQSNFMALETWGNEYDDEHNMLGRGSFRLHTSDIEDYAKQMEAEGWTRCEAPKRKQT